MLQDIEKRLGRPVFPLAADMSLPPQVSLTSRACYMHVWLCACTSLQT